MTKEQLSSQDTWTGWIGYYGHAHVVFACGWCGASGLNDFPADCCEAMVRWHARLAKQAAPSPIPDEPDPHSHEEMRWARVCRRLAAKHRP